MTGAGSACVAWDMPDERRKRSTEIVDQPEQEVRQPPLFRVVIHNDDYTSMEFVVSVLESIFMMHPAEAYRVMMQVHRDGRGPCGVYPYEIAETKVCLVHDLARDRGFPLRASTEDA
jgi:ATP-dependent Clp protease adaptor protein ClpS